VPIVLVVSATVPARSVAELVALARAHPGNLNYGSIGPGSTGHLLGEMLRRGAGIDIVHVPYKGAAPGVTALLAGEVQLFFFPVFVDARALVRSGALRPLALVDSRRSPVAPDLPTLPELGYPLEAAAWFALIAPAGTPEAIVAAARPGSAARPFARGDEALPRRTGNRGGRPGAGSAQGLHRLRSTPATVAWCARRACRSSDQIAWNGSSVNDVCTCRGHAPPTPVRVLV